MSILKQLDKVQRASQNKGQLHIQYLQALADHGPKVTMEEALNFLSRLRKTRDDILHGRKGPSNARLQRWASDCTSHAGYTTLNKVIFENSQSIDNASNTILSRVYNNLQRINFRSDAEKLWPAVSERVSAGTMDTGELLGIWSVAPKDRLSELDSGLAKAMHDGSAPKAWQLLSALNRANDMPECKVLETCASLMLPRLQDMNSEDIAALVAQLGKLSDLGGSLQNTLDNLKARAKDEIIRQSGGLEASQLCAMLSAIRSHDDPLWAFIRKQLVGKSDLGVQQVLDILSFLNRVAAKREEQFLRGELVKKLQKSLNQGYPEPETVANIARHLDAIIGSQAACQSLLNTAVKLRNDLYPIVLWRLFVRASEARLLEHHPSLQSRMQRIGEILEDHGIQKQRMTLQEMADVATAMQVHKVKLERCSKQMSRHFVEVLRSGSAASSQQTGEPSMVVEEAPTASSETISAQTESSAAETEQPEVAETKAEVSNMDDKPETETAAAKAEESTANASDSVGIMLGEIQRLLVSFWAKLNSLGLVDESLTDAAKSVCSPTKDCQIEAKFLASCDAELSSSEGEAAADLRSGLAAHFTKSLPGLPSNELFEIASCVVTPAMQNAIATEICNRQTLENGGMSILEGGVEFDAMVSFLANAGMQSSRAHGEVSVELVDRIVQLVCDSLMPVLSGDLSSAQRRLVATTKACSSFGLPDKSRQLLRWSVHNVAESQKLWRLEDAVELSFSMACLHGGELPLDVTLRLWHLAGGAIDQLDSSNLSQRQLAKLWSFLLAARQLSSTTTLASLRLAPNAAALETLLVNKDKLHMVGFELANNSASASAEVSDPTSLIGQLRATLPAALPAENCEERFHVSGTPYIADFGFEHLRTLLVIPRADHVSSLAGKQIGGQGLLMERTLETLGWRICWMWPQDWSAKLVSPSQEAVDALQTLLSPSTRGPEESRPKPVEDE